MPLPGQRAAQQPLRAAIAAQRALGRAARDASALTERLVAFPADGGPGFVLHVGDDDTEHRTWLQDVEQEGDPDA